MSWLDLFKYVTYALGTVILFFWILIIYRAVTKKSELVPVRRLMYILAIVAVGMSIARSSQLYGSTVVFADLIVLFCILAAFARSEKKRDEPS
ncbi:hypothetical protein SDC9_47356 [bioreactor metagenome]|uniref:Uncharacterized protein n=1 Tax=bioreactor metagenome TaxID=1076179 RepID=A0A644WC80_9ZZZZ